LSTSKLIVADGSHVSATVEMPDRSELKQRLAAAI
jgi:hypothetical protein